MADTTFSNGTVVAAAWLNDVNDHVYNGTDFDGNVPLNAKDPTFGATGDGVTNDTTAMQAFFTACYNQQRAGYIPAGTYLVGNLSLTFTGNRLSQGLMIYGDGRNLTTLKQTGTPTQLLKFTSSSPTTAHSPAQIVLRDMKFMGITALPTCMGLTLESVSDWTIERVLFEGFTKAVNISSALVGTIDTCQISNSPLGIYTRLNGTSAYCNAITVRKSIITGCSTFGMDIGHADGLIVDDCLFETNGTSANTATGAIMIRDTCDNETAYAQILLRDNKYEVNVGRTIQVEAMASGLDLVISGGYTLSSESGRDLVIAGARRVKITAFNSKSTPSIWDITADQLLLMNTRVTTLTDTGVTYPNYIHAEANSTTYINGKASSYTGTLTGCTTSPTGSITYIQDGNEVTLTFAANITGTSNTTAATITGMPASIRPTATRSVLGICHDAGTEKASVLAIGTNGTITLANGFSATFTNSGTKGVSALTLASYKI